MAAKLVAEEGILKGLVLSLESGTEWTIGRDPDECELVIEDPSASRKHLVCRAAPEGILVENLSTTNPILVNEETIEEPKLLQQGDTVRIGSGTFRFYEEGEAHVFGEEDEKAAEEEKAEMEQAPNPEDAPEEEAADEYELTSENQSDEEEVDQPSRDSIFEEAEAGKQPPELATITFDISEAGRWLLKVVAGPNSGAEFAMQTKHNYLIGTDPNSCDIVFHDNSVSRQHARIYITAEDKVMIEDIGSRNGTLIDGEKLEGKQSLETNMLVTLGTTSFVIFDREGEMQTIISPLLPSIVKSLQESREEEKESEEIKEVKPEKKKESGRTVGSFIALAIVTAVVVVAGIGITTLFTEESKPVRQEVNYEKQIQQALAPFSDIRYQYSESSGSLLLIGHVLKASDKTRLRNIVDELTFVRYVDDRNVVIDEQIWREINQVLARNPNWKGITIHAPKPGVFVISGYLQTRLQSEELWDYLNANFPFLDLLQKRIVVEEDVLKDVNNKLESLGFTQVLVTMSQGEVTLAGTIPRGSKPKYEEMVKSIQEIPGLSRVRSFVQEAAPEESVVNLSDQYTISGFSRKGNVNYSVVINGRILTMGDQLDGMTITAIRDNYILLKKGDVIYRIDYNR